jgi:hypothetical protein
MRQGSCERRRIPHPGRVAAGAARDTAMTWGTMGAMAIDPTPETGTVREAQLRMELAAILTHLPEAREAVARARAQEAAGWPDRTWSDDEVEVECPSPARPPR